jgi:ABC-type lipoprotein release transport system permease subunit
MGLAFKLAFRNLIGAGLRTWLNVIVLAFAFILIVFYHGMNSGWNEQAKNETIEWQVGKGELRNNEYDPYDPFTIADGHGVIEEPEAKNLEPVLIRQGSIYPDGRMFSAILRGMNVDQQAVKIPIHLLKESKAEFPVLIGKRMAASAKLEKGDQVLMRWRDAHGTYDATTVTVAAIFDCNLPGIDDGQIYMDLQKMYAITGFPQNTATYFIDTKGQESLELAGWNYHDQKSLLKFIDDLAEMDAIGAMVMYSLLLAIALLAIFDTQVLSIFRRQREIGTYIALGMTLQRVVGMFTIEGSMYSIMASIMGMGLGYPLFAYFADKGIGMGGMESGMAMAERIYPVYGLGLIVSTTILVIVSATIVSFLPAKKIAKMDPVDALKGKLQ